MKSGWLLYISSLALHGVLGMSVSFIPTPLPAPVPVEITLLEAPPPEPPPEPPNVEPEAPRRVAPVAAAPAPRIAPTAPPPAAAPLALGVTLSGGDAGAGGVGVPVGDPRGTPREALTTRVAAVKELAAAPATAPVCEGESRKAKPLVVPRPEFTEEARAAGIEGKVRVEIEVAVDGSVSAARVIEGLGHGLDEAAIRALRSARFDPALQCGQPIAATFVIAVRFAK